MFHHHHHHHNRRRRHGKNIPFSAISFLRRIFRQIYNHPVFNYLNFATLFFFSEQSRQSRRTSNLEDQVPVFMSPNDRVAQLYP
jgi:hypothetical protein